MGASAHDRGRLGRRAGLLVLAAALVALAACSATAPQAAPLPEASAAAAPSTSPPPTFRSSREPVGAGLPRRVRLPALGLDAPVGRVGQAADGTVEVPRRWQDVGWFDGGARPGDPGPAVLLGHVDSRSGPAVFVRVPQARTGMRVEVTDDAGAVHRFRVVRVERFPKVRFPTEAVYLPVLRPELRLVTCGGSFDRRSGHYRDNVVVFAELEG